MEHDLQQSVALLSRTPACLDSLLRHLPSEWTEANEGGNSFSAHDAVVHLINAEKTNWMPRVIHILHNGDSHPFPSFNRFAGVAGQPLTQLLDQFAHARADSLKQLADLNLQPEDLRESARHPTFGVVTLSQLLATWAVHDLTHLHQISRVLAHQYRHAVGPWNAFLGVLKCSGHSD